MRLPIHQFGRHAQGQKRAEDHNACPHIKREVGGVGGVFDEADKVRAGEVGDLAGAIDQRQTARGGGNRRTPIRDEGSSSVPP